MTANWARSAFWAQSLPVESASHGLQGIKHGHGLSLKNRPCPSSSLTLAETKLGPAQNGNRLCPLIRRWPSLPNPGRNRFLDGVLWAALEKVSCRVLLKECVKRAYLTFSQSPHERMRVETKLPTAMGPTHSNGQQRVNVDPRWRRPGHVQGRRPEPVGEASS